MDGTDAVAMMQREMRVREGAVVPELDGFAVALGTYRMTSDAFLTNLTCGLSILYRKGEGITVDRASTADPRDELLYLNGMTYAAVATINGLYPIHASAVAVDGRVHAFTGPSGAGKSTLIAELGRRGFPMFCDDTLVLDLRDPERIMCLPGHKRLKLLPDALTLTGAMRQEKVADGIDKFFAEPSAGIIAVPLPLSELVFLENGSPARIEPVSGGERMTRLQDDHYTAHFIEIACRADHAVRFNQLSRLARSIRINRFIRPRDARRFSADVAIVATHLTPIAEQQQ